MEWADETGDAELVRGAYNLSAQTVATLLQTMEEYRLAIIAILGDDQMLVLPTMNCVRAIHDAALRICSLADPTLSSPERLARSAANFLSNVQGGIPVLHTLEDLLGSDNKMDLSTAIKKRAGAIELFRNMGLDVKVKEHTGEAQNVRCQGYVANVELKSTDLSLKYTPRVHFAWRLNSGATLSNIWLTHGLDGPWEQILVSMIFPVLDISDALAANLLGYVGLPVTEIHRATHLRRLILLQRTGVGAPYSDSDYYQQNP